MRPRHALLVVLTLGALGSSACDDQPATALPPEDAMAVATAALTDAGATSLGAVGGNGQSDQTASVTLPQGSTVGVFAACTGGGGLDLDLAGTVQPLDCDGRAHQLDDLTLPDDELPVFGVSRPSEEPSAWGVAFARLDATPPP